MKYNGTLSKEQQNNVEMHLYVVHHVIRYSIIVNETIYGFSYDDLFQEGCILLCHAALTYNADRAKFQTYAKAVVRNGLISYCRQMCRRQSRFSYLEPGESGEYLAGITGLGEADKLEGHISMMETLSLLESVKQEYHGVARLGIEALELKIKGVSMKDIAALYQVPTSHVGAWISRSAKKLRNNPAFIKDVF